MVGILRSRKEGGSDHWKECLLFTTVCLRIYFPLILTGYKSPGGKGCHIQLVYLSSDWKYRRGTLCTASLKTKMPKMPGELCGDWYPQACNRILLPPFTAQIKRNPRWLRCPNAKAKTKLLLCFWGYFETHLSCTPKMFLSRSFYSVSHAGLLTGPLLPLCLRHFSKSRFCPWKKTYAYQSE